MLSFGKSETIGVRILRPYFGQSLPLHVALLSNFFICLLFVINFVLITIIVDLNLKTLIFILLLFCYELLLPLFFIFVCFFCLIFLLLLLLLLLHSAVTYRPCKRVWLYVKVAGFDSDTFGGSRSLSTLFYCALGPTLAASTKLMCIFNSTSKSMQSGRTLFGNGEMAMTLPTAALSGCGFGSLKCETENSTSKYLFEVM